jgi:hypothetical protein
MARKTQKTKDLGDSTVQARRAELLARMTKGLGRTPVAVAVEEDIEEAVTEAVEAQSELGEDEFVAEGEAHPDDVAAVMAESLSMVKPTDEDLDRLWDWVRQDTDRGQRFLGTRVVTYRQMHELIEAFVAKAILMSLMDVDGHIGFVGLQVQAGGNVIVHLYLAQSARGQLGRLIPQLQRIAQRDMPGLTLLIMVTDPALARLYAPFGFETTYLLKWTSQPAAAV